MKLARIILPERDNNNETLVWNHEQLKRDLVGRYGGFTMTKGYGGWRSSSGSLLYETVWIYDVAMERADVQSFRQLAREVARYARQECVMIVTPQGDVEFLKPVQPSIDEQAEKQIKAAW